MLNLVGYILFDSFLLYIFDNFMIFKDIKILKFTWIIKNCRTEK